MKGIQELYRLRLAENIKAGDTTPMMVFPIGEWHSTLYPDLALTEDLANEMIANFEAGILGTEPVVDSSGKHDTSVPAAGWVKRVYLASYEEGDVTGLALWADVKWTGIGATMLSDDQYKYGSVEIGPVTLNDTGEKVDNVLRSLTLTNTPVLRLMPGVKNAAEKQRSVVTLSLSEVTLAAIPEFIKVKMRAKWLKANPGKTEDDVPENMKASEVSLASVAPSVTSILDDMDALAEKLDAQLKGKAGMPAMRTMLKEVRTKASAHALDEDPEDPGDHAEPIDGSSDAASQPAKADEGQDVVLADGDAATKGVDHHMDIKTLTILKLAEGASDEAVDVAVSALSERVTTAETALTERDKAESKRDFEAKLAEAMKPDEKQVVHILPGQKDMFLSLAEKDHGGALAFLDEAMKGTGFQLGAVGSGTEGDDKPTKRADVELSELTQARMVKDGIDYPKAMGLTLAENHNEIRERYQNFLDGKEG